MIREWSDDLPKSSRVLIERLMNLISETVGARSDMIVMMIIIIMILILLLVLQKLFADTVQTNIHQYKLHYGIHRYLLQAMQAHFLLLSTNCL